MSSRTIPADGRVQVVTQGLLDRDALTIRAEENGPDIRVYASEDDEGTGFPLRSDDEFAIREEEGLGSVASADGIWMETEGSESTTIQILKGVAIRRNVRREVRVDATVTVDSYDIGASFDYAGNYPHTINPSATVQEILLSIVGAEVSVELTTLDGDVVTIPVDQKASIDSYRVSEFTIRDPNGNSPRVAGGWAGE